MSAPDPVADDLWVELAEPTCRPEVLDLLDYPDHIRRGSDLEPLESVSLDDLDADWENLQRQLQHEAEAIRRARDEHGMTLASTYTAYSLDGTAREESAQRRNGTPIATSKRGGDPGP